MSDIKVGDLVMIVRGHSCVVASKGGIPFIVNEIAPCSGGAWFCPVCNSRNIAAGELGAKFVGQKRCGVPLSWLKKIPPLSEPETVERKEEVRA